MLYINRMLCRWGVMRVGLICGFRFMGLFICCLWLWGFFITWLRFYRLLICWLWFRSFFISVLGLYMWFRGVWFWFFIGGLW